MISHAETQTEGAAFAVEQLDWLRISIAVPDTPRFVLSFVKQKFLNIKQFISYISDETGISQSEEKQPAYLLMLDDAIVLNMDSVRDNDRLQLIPATKLQAFQSPKPQPEAKTSSTCSTNSSSSHCKDSPRKSVL